MILRRRVAAAGLAAVALLVLLRVAAVETVTIGGDSMSPGLRRGDTALIEKITFRVRAPHRTEVVAFTSPQDGELALKRVAAVGGDDVEIRDAVLYLNGCPVTEPQVDLAADDGTWFGPVHVPAGQLFLLGDNRANSIDSRSYGPVPVGAVVGRAVS